MYKLKKISHLLQFKEKNYFKPMCCIIISNKLEENKEFYETLKNTLISIQNDKNYVAIYLINTDKFEDENKTYEELEKDKPYFLMFFRSIQYEFFNNPVNEFIPNIASKIYSINDGYLANIAKAFTSKDKKVEEVIDKKENISEKNSVVKKENNKKENTKSNNVKKDNTKTNNTKNNKKHIEPSEELSEQLSQELSEDINSSITSENNSDNDIQEKKRLLKEKQKKLQEIDED